MKNVAIIAEYNPLHNGHLYQMEQIGKDNNIIVALSGNFTERGDIAILNKYQRAKFAVLHGASMVVEIPTFGVLFCAEHYAKCATKVLSLLGIVDELNFGSECGDIDKLKKVADIEEDTAFKDNLATLLKSGLSYPNAISKAMSDSIGNSDILDKPNNILGIEYIKALKHSSITPTTIKRCGNDYNDTNLSDGTFASATSIRRHRESPLIAQYLPDDVRKSITSIDINEDIIFSTLYQKLVIDNDDISDILNISEGIDNRIKESLTLSNDYQSLLDNIKTKRYTLAKIKRTLLDILLGIQSDMQTMIDSIDYVTVLGIRRDKLDMLKNIKANIITKFNDYKKTIHPFAMLDIKANRLYNLLSTDKINDHRMIIVD